MFRGYVLKDSGVLGRDDRPFIFFHQGPIGAIGKGLQFARMGEGPIQFFRQVSIGAGSEEKHFIVVKDIGILDDIGAKDGDPEGGDFE